MSRKKSISSFSPKISVVRFVGPEHASTDRSACFRDCEIASSLVSGNVFYLGVCLSFFPLNVKTFCGVDLIIAREDYSVYRRQRRRITLMVV